MASGDNTLEIAETAVGDQIQMQSEEKAIDDFVAMCRVCLKDDRKKRSFWIDNLLKFLDIDTIPQGLIDQLSKMNEWNLFFLEPWLRATAQRGYFEEEDQALENLLPQFEALRCFTAWVAAENGHKKMVLALMKGQDANSLLGSRFMIDLSSRWVYFIWQFLMQRDCFATELDISLWKELERYTFSYENDWTFLHFAAACGDVTCIEELLKHYSVDRPTKEGYTALHLAAYYDNVGIVNSLLGHGADVNVRDETGRTPLHHASEQGCLASVNALLEHALIKGSAMKLVEMVDVNGMTALHLASCRGQTQVVTALLFHADTKQRSHGKDLTHEKAFIARSLRQWRNSTQVVRIRYVRAPLEACFNGDASTFLRPNRLKSQVWSPGGFSALHFAVVYGNNIDTIHEILKHEESEALVMIKDSLGLTPIDWAQVVDRKEAQETLEAKAPHEYFCNTSRKVTCIKAKWHYEQVTAAEQERMRLQWTLEISEALLCMEWDDVRRLTSEGVLKQIKVKVDDCVWEHLQSVISDTLKLCYRTRKYRASMIERMVVELVKGKAFSNNDSAMQKCLMWAIEQDMVDLVEAIVRDNGDNKCDLLSVARGCDHKSSPLQAATDKGERGSQLVAVMEQREDVQKRLYEDRQVYVDYANTILVGAVLIAALAYQGWVQKPQGYAGMPLNSNTKGMLVFAWCNSLGFFLSMGGVLAAAVAAMPLRRGRLVRFREKSVRAGMVASVLMAASVACEVIGFAVALVSVESHKKSMVGLASTSSIIVLMLAVWFFSRVNELHPFLDFLREFLFEFLFGFPDFLRDFLLNYVCHPFYSRPFQLYVWSPLYLYVFHPLKRSSFGGLIISSCWCILSIIPCILSCLCDAFHEYFIRKSYAKIQDYQFRLKEWAEQVARRVETLSD